MNNMYQKFAIFVRNNLLYGELIFAIIIAEISALFSVLPGICFHNDLKARFLMKRHITFNAVASMLLVISLLFCGCSAAASPSPAPSPSPQPKEEAAYQKFSRTDLSVFDTVITLTGFTQSQEDFDRAAEETFALLSTYDHIFDGYNAYDGLHNLYYVNKHAAEAPVEIPDALFDLIAWCKEKWDSGLTQTNIAMGAVLSIWHEYRTAGMANPSQARIPSEAELLAASKHTDFDTVQLDAEKRTVYFSDPAVTLDIGAVAKGYAADKAAEYLYQVMPSFLLSLGGNVYAGNAPEDGRTNWAVGVQNPDITVNTTIDILDVHDKTVVTSGDYWRYYTVDGQRYHHIIDPETLMPSRKMISVTILCEESCLADFLSTALFVLSYEEGRAVADSLPGVEVMWILPDGTIKATDGMRDYARSMKNPS